MNFLKKFIPFKRRKPRTGEPSKVKASDVFRVKYLSFKELLDSNAELLNTIADLEEKLQGQQVFGMSYVRSQAAHAAFHTSRMIRGLNAISGQKYSQLYTVLETINGKIKEELEKKKEVPLTEFILPYSRINKEMVDWVGGKSANLGEVVNRVKLPIPAGFAITTYGFQFFLAHNDLVDEINKRKLEIDPDQPETVTLASEEIQALIISAKIPSALEEAILAAYDHLSETVGGGESSGFSPRVALRSSAIGEDTALSFAGQYLSILNVPREKLLQSYQYIIASLYTPRAIIYRLNKGVRDEDIAMSVACLEMVESMASGVAYSRHPFNLLENNVMINAVWGLGPYAVDGVVTPDTYMVAKDEALSIVQTRLSHKPVQLVSNPEGGLTEIPVEADKRDISCLTAEQIRILAGYAINLEKHYGCPQDIEWALTRNGRLMVLQSRPLRLHARPVRPETREKGGLSESTPLVPGYLVLVEGGTVAFPGVGCGPAYHIRSEEDLLNFPDGAVVVARRSSPRFVMVMRKAQAIITDAGSVTGHMASLAREFGVPSILAAKGASSTISPGMEITVDAYSGRVYQGKVSELLAMQISRTPHMRGTAVYRTLRGVADLIVPLHLLDPKAPTFRAESCQTFHDIMRLVHELSYTEMFQLSDLVSHKEGAAVKLKAPIPLDLYLMDLGGGLSPLTERVKKVTVAEIASLPLRALLKGLLHEDLRWHGPRPVDLGGFFSVMKEQMLRPPNQGERFGDRSYAIISDKYLNFSSRVGYHYSILDSYCGQTINKNYITFSFKGGAADDARRNRRARAIAQILKELDFSVEVKGDRVDARFQKYERPVIEEKLDMVGRLLQFTRQMDMLMKSEASVAAIARSFLAGHYQLEEDFFDKLYDEGDKEAR